jgi:hypothetical protein
VISSDTLPQPEQVEAGVRGARLNISLPSPEEASKLASAAKPKLEARNKQPLLNITSHLNKDGKSMRPLDSSVSCL